MKIIKPLTYSLPVFENKKVTILGTGNVTKSLLLTAALLRPHIQFKVIARSIRSAELIRVFLNDLPSLQVEVVTLPTVPDLTDELVVLTLGTRTGKFSRKTKKESLQQKNKNIIVRLLPQLKSSTVLVVTNPSTAITQFLIEQGVRAYGIGVANDQFRFHNHTENTLHNQYFVGGHNFHDLIIGSFHATTKNEFLFSHNDYKTILKSQDKKTFSLKNLPYSILDYTWEKLTKTNAGLPPEYRWYARQRIHSKFHSTTISCSLAILNTICYLVKEKPLFKTFSLETLLYLEENDTSTVLGWPIDGITMELLALTFGEPEIQKLYEVSEKYEVNRQNKKNLILYLTSPFGETISLTGNTSIIHNFYKERLFPLFKLSALPHRDMKILAEIHICDSRKAIDEIVNKFPASSWKTVPQHRGKNPHEFADLEILPVNHLRIIKFPGATAIGKFDDVKKKIDLFFEDQKTLHYELRRLLRDEVGIPCFITRGARVLHSGLVRVKGLSVLILGRSGGGKTTAVFSLLTANVNASYGSSERTMVWIADTKIMAVGIPDSTTVYPGTLAQIPQFEPLSKQIDPDDYWVRNRKVRIQHHTIINTSHSHLIPRETPIDLVIEVDYQKENPNATSKIITDARERKEVFLQNDITENDAVRLPWLEWFPKHFKKDVYHFLKTDQSLDMYRITWSNQDALKEMLITIIARKKLYRREFDTATEPNIPVL